MVRRQCLGATLPLLLLALAAVVGVPSAAQEATARFGSGATAILLRSTTDIAIIRPVMERFVARNPELSVRYEQWGSNALFAASRAACAGEGDQADAVFSSAVHQMVWLVNAACGHRYQSARTAALPATRRWRDELWGITEEPAVIVYNTDRISGAEVPRNRFTLLDLMRSNPPHLRGRIATYDIEASGLGYLFAHSDSLEATTFGAVLEGFARMEAVATCCSAEIIRGVAEGRYLIAYNVLGSYVASATFANVGVILPEDYTLILSRAFMIPRDAAHKPEAARLLDFLLSDEAQHILRDIGLVLTRDPSETGLLPSARRFIALSPALLVALDRNKRDQLFTLWGQAFTIDNRP
ncbi:iron-binding protein [Meridianimarinicoccus roseus]|uniref:Iron-binding protein n=2 Tax=Meridianimarinicoccus roseus TaxID=2072018 RepID=A0A2V2L784_9RHOB|nr:ABC transporter substrate-binding protein [Meridianimarinicoccus roseus]PWR01210.1 iron-binding protein [Meridianimarinicoccus roseus]